MGFFSLNPFKKFKSGLKIGKGLVNATGRAVGGFGMGGKLLRAMPGGRALGKFGRIGGFDPLGIGGDRQRGGTPTEGGALGNIRSRFGGGGGDMRGMLMARRNAAQQMGGSPMDAAIAPERTPGVMATMGRGMPPPTESAMPAMLNARRDAAMQMRQFGGPQPAPQGAFGPGLDGAQQSMRPRRGGFSMRKFGGGME